MHGFTFLKVPDFFNILYSILKICHEEYFNGIGIIGQDILDDLGGSGNNITPQNKFINNITQIAKYSTGSGLPNVMDGVVDEMRVFAEEVQYDCQQYTASG